MNVPGSIWGSGYHTGYSAGYSTGKKDTVKGVAVLAIGGIVIYKNRHKIGKFLKKVEKKLFG